MNAYDQILRMYTGDDELRPWMMKPFLLGEFVYATNAIKIIRIPKSKCKATYEELGDRYTGHDSITRIFREANTIAGFSVKHLNDLIRSAPMDPTVDWETCGHCDGQGEWTNEDETELIRCKMCNGDGEITIERPGVFEINFYAVIELNDCHISATQLDTLVRSANELGIENILYKGGEERTAHLFQFDDIEIGIMGMLKDFNNKVVG